jgi:hypothetical protein
MTRGGPYGRPGKTANLMRFRTLEIKPKRAGRRAGAGIATGQGDGQNSSARTRHIYNVSHARRQARRDKGLLRAAHGHNQSEENRMDPKTVRKLEDELEKPIGEVIRRLDLKKLPFLPSRRTIEMMAKAAVAVYEAADEEHERRSEK